MPVCIYIYREICLLLYSKCFSNKYESQYNTQQSYKGPLCDINDKIIMPFLHPYKCESQPCARSSFKWLLPIANLDERPEDFEMTTRVKYLFLLGVNLLPPAPPVTFPFRLLDTLVLEYSLSISSYSLWFLGPSISSPLLNKHSEARKLPASSAEMQAQVSVSQG